MKKGQDLVAEFPGLFIIHQKIPGREVGRHCHKEHEFFLPLQGEISLQFEDKKITGGPGRMTYAPPDLEHSFSSRAVGEGERVFFLIDKKTWKDNGGKEAIPSVLHACSLVRELIFFLLLHPKSQGVSTFVTTLVQVLSEQLETQGDLARIEGNHVHLIGKVQDQRIRRAMELLQAAAEQPSMPELARQCGLSVRNLNRLFLDEAGMTPKQFGTWIRIEAAKTLLKTTGTTITDIAHEVGYQSLSKFIASFQKQTGQLPSEFRHRVDVR